MTVETPIDGERSRRVAEIVGEALELPSRERSAFLDAACGGDAALRGAVETLLAADRTESFPGTAPPAGSLIGSTLAHYRILERLGAGGMGEVYLAEDETLGRRVALKLLPPALAGHPDRLARFRREARTVAALNHPNIVTLHSIEEARGLHFLTLERVDGVTLRERIVPGGLPAAEVVRLALPLAEAVAAAHAQGITHRDLKPANVMISNEGRIKVLDFGIARPAAGAGSPDGEPTALTADGWVPGTVAYMSPEQIVGHTVDLRSDVFSLGVVLFELATGEHPFAAPSRAETISKILRDPPEAAGGAALPHRLGEIIGRCLEKDPDRRYPDARALGEDLRALQMAKGNPPVGRRRFGPAVAAGLSIAALAIAVLLWTGRSLPKPPAPAPASPSLSGPAHTAVAVLPFQNLTGDPQLDWLRAGLAEMLITDLSQSSRLDVLGGDRLHQILTDLGALDDLERGPPSFDLVRQVARRAAAGQVIRGSYAQAGSEVRITLQVEDAETGRIVGSERVQGPGGERLFSLVDRLAAAAHRQLGVAAPSSPRVALQEVTTSSSEAWRLYIEALALQRRAKSSEAIVLLERAVELDPDFALALNALGMLHGSLGHPGLSLRYAGQAVAKAEHLPVHLRSLIQGRYFMRRWGTYGQALASFREYLRLYPDQEAPRDNLAHVEAWLEQYDEAIRDYEALLATGPRSVQTAASAASLYPALGQFETGRRQLLDLAAREPESWLAPAALGWLLTQWGKLDEAEAALQQAEALRPGEPSVVQARWRLAVLRGDRGEAERAARELAEHDDPYTKWRGALSLARNAQARGDFPAALEHLSAAARAMPQPDAFTAMAHVWTADLLLDLGEPARALAEARRAQQIAPGDWPELQGMFLAALARQELGHPQEADALLAELKRRAAANPNPVEERQILHLEGRLALARGDAGSAVASLRQAASLLPPEGLEIHFYVQPDHVPVWYDLGRAELAAGHPAEARKWLQQAAAAGAEQIEFPVAHGRAAELLRRIAGP